MHIYALIYAWYFAICICRCPLLTCPHARTYACICAYIHPELHIAYLFLNFFAYWPTQVYLDRTCVRTNILMCVVPQAGLQIDEEILYSKLPFFKTTYLTISTLLDILGTFGNFFALWTLCISGRIKIEAAVSLFSVLPRFQLHVECRPGSVVNKSPKQAEIIE